MPMDKTVRPATFCVLLVPFHKVQAVRWTILRQNQELESMVNTNVFFDCVALITMSCSISAGTF